MPEVSSLFAQQAVPLYERRSDEVESSSSFVG